MDQFLSGWVKQRDVMVDELTTQEPSKGSRLQHEGVCKTRRRDGAELNGPKSSYDFQRVLMISSRKAMRCCHGSASNEGACLRTPKRQPSKPAMDNSRFFRNGAAIKGGQIFTANA